MESSAKRPLFLSPTQSSTETRVRVDYPVDKLFSPMDICGEKDRRSLGGCSISSSTTPRRKLSLDVDENAQSPLAFDDAGYSGSQGSYSSLETSLNRGAGSAPLETPLVGAMASASSETKPFTIVNSESSRRRRTLQARRLRKNVSSSVLSEGYKWNCGIGDGPMPIKIPRTSSLSLRPSSLPSSPLPHEGTPGTQPSSLLRQINSPLERMSLMSPVNTHPLHLHRPPSTTSSVAESDGYFSEVFDGEEMEEATGDSASSQPVPGAISSLLSAPMSSFVSKYEFSRPNLVCPTPVRPSASLTSSLPASFITGARGREGAVQSRRGSLKRSSPCSESAIQQRAKRPPLPVFTSSSNTSPKKTLKGVPLLRSQSYSVAHSEMSFFPCSPGNDDRELTGDFTRPCVLPLVKGNVADLKCISPETLSVLLQGDHYQEVYSYTVVDCRYPYEFDGGHIAGAINIWDKDSLLERFFKVNPSLPSDDDEKRSIIIYHCEFSSRRGPDMSRFMRKIDRERNGMNFPRLHYPELYLLLGGYKAFYEKHPDLCEPISYRTMADENHTADLKHFKYRSKSWNGESNSRKRKPLLRHRRATVYDQPSALGGVSSSVGGSPSTN